MTRNEITRNIVNNSLAILNSHKNHVREIKEQCSALSAVTSLYNIRSAYLLKLQKLRYAWRIRRAHKQAAVRIQFDLLIIKYHKLSC